MTHIKSRITREKKIVELMIRLYCKRKERNRELCPACQDLLKYAHARLAHCPFGEKKSTCRLCTVHCYKPEMRQRMQSVMRYAGPRMLLYHPIAAIRHLMEETGHLFFTHTNKLKIFHISNHFINFAAILSLPQKQD